MESKTKKTSKNRLTRRGFVVSAGAAATLSGFPLVLSGKPARGAKQFEGKTIRILTWTDVTGQAAVQHIAQPFQETTGAKVVADLTGATSEMVAKVKASAANPQYDVVILSAVGAFELAQAGLLQKPDVSRLANLSDVIPDARLGADGHAVGYLLWCDGILYNTKVFGSAPESFGVLWDEQHAGKIVLPPPHWAAAMDLTVVAARMAGGDEYNPEPGFKKLEELKDRVLLLSGNPAQISDLIRSGALNVGAPFSPNMWPEFLGKPEYNLSLTLAPKEGFFFDLQYMVMLKDHPGDDDVAHAFVNFALDPAVQGRMAEAVFYGPINQKTVLSEKAKTIPYIVTAEQVEERGIKFDKSHIAKVRQDWIQRYTEIFSA